MNPEQEIPCPVCGEPGYRIENEDHPGSYRIICIQGHETPISSARQVFAQWRTLGPVQNPFSPWSR